MLLLASKTMGWKPFDKVYLQARRPLMPAPMMATCLSIAFAFSVFLPPSKWISIYLNYMKHQSRLTVFFVPTTFFFSNLHLPNVVFFHFYHYLSRMLLFLVVLILYFCRFFTARQHNVTWHREILLLFFFSVDFRFHSYLFSSFYAFFCPFFQ